MRLLQPPSPSSHPTHNLNRSVQISSKPPLPNSSRSHTLVGIFFHRSPVPRLISPTKMSSNVLILSFEEKEPLRSQLHRYSCIFLNRPYHTLLRTSYTH